MTKIRYFIYPGFGNILSKHDWLLFFLVLNFSLGNFVGQNPSLLTEYQPVHPNPVIYTSYNCPRALKVARCNPVVEKASSSPYPSQPNCQLTSVGCADGLLETAISVNPNTNLPIIFYGIKTWLPFFQKGNGSHHSHKMQLRIALCEEKECLSPHVTVVAKGDVGYAIAISNQVLDQKPLFAYYKKDVHHSNDSLILQLAECADKSCHTIRHLPFSVSGPTEADVQSIDVQRGPKPDYLPLVSYHVQNSQGQSILQIAACLDQNCSKYTTNATIIDPSVGLSSLVLMRHDSVTISSWLKYPILVYAGIERKSIKIAFCYDAICNNLIYRITVYNMTTEGNEKGRVHGVSAFQGANGLSILFFVELTLQNRALMMIQCNSFPCQKDQRTISRIKKISPSVSQFVFKEMRVSADRAFIFRTQDCMNNSTFSFECPVIVYNVIEENPDTGEKNGRLYLVECTNFLCDKEHRYEYILDDHQMNDIQLRDMFVHFDAIFFLYLLIPTMLLVCLMAIKGYVSKSKKQGDKSPFLSNHSIDKAYYTYTKMLIIATLSGSAITLIPFVLFLGSDIQKYWPMLCAVVPANFASLLIWYTLQSGQRIWFTCSAIFYVFDIILLDVCFTMLIRLYQEACTPLTFSFCVLMFAGMIIMIISDLCMIFICSRVHRIFSFYYAIEERKIRHFSASFG